MSKTPCDHVGRLAQRIRLPWEIYGTDRAVARRPGAASRIEAELVNGRLTLTVELRHTEGESLDSLCDRARAAVVELLDRMATADQPCPHLAHTDPRAGRAGRCPECGAVIGGET